MLPDPSRNILIENQDNETLRLIFLGAYNNKVEYGKLSYLLKKQLGSTNRKRHLAHTFLSFYWGCNIGGNRYIRFRGKMDDFLIVAEFFSDKEEFEISSAEFCRRSYDKKYRLEIRRK